jgi:hypothetical protein
MNRGNSVSDVDVYDPDSDLWTPFAGLLIAVRSFNCAVLDDTIYVAGGVNDSNTIIDVVQVDSMIRRISVKVLIYGDFNLFRI